MALQSLNYVPTHHLSLTSHQQWAKPQRPGILGQPGSPQCQGWKAFSVHLVYPSSNGGMGKLRPKEGKDPLPPPSPVCIVWEPVAGLELGASPVLFPSLLCSPQVPRGRSGDYAPPPSVATPHLVFVCSILHGSVWDNSLQAGSAPWEQAANELQMSRPNCSRKADAEMLALIKDTGQWWWLREVTSSSLHRVLNSQLGSSRCQCFTPETLAGVSVSRKSGKGQGGWRTKAF